MSEYELTEEQKKQLKPWADKYIAHAFKTGTLASEQRESIRKAIFGLYEKANLAAPRIVTFAPSPYTAAIAYGVCEGALDSSATDAAKYVSGLAVAKERTELAMGRLRAADVDAKPVSDGVTESIIEEVMKLVVEICFNGVKPEIPKKTRKDDALVKAMTDGVRASHEAANAGNQASAWVAHVTFFRYIVKLEADYSRWDNYEKAADGGPRYMHEQFTIVSDLPSRVCVDQNNRAHAADGPSHSWRDGWKVYSWRGTRVPASWIEDKESLDPMAAINWRNIEQRRCAADILGWDKIVQKLSPKVIDKNPNPQIGTLLEVDLPDAGASRFLQVQCGTGRTFCLPVQNRCRTALEANASTFNLKPEELLKMEFRT